MEKLRDIATELQNLQHVTNDILRDIIGDYKKKLNSLIITIVVLIICMSGTFVFLYWQNNVMNTEYQKNIKQLAEDYDKRFIDFLSEYDFETTYEYSQNLDITDNSNAEDVNKIDISGQ